MSEGILLKARTAKRVWPFEGSRSGWGNVMWVRDVMSVMRVGAALRRADACEKRVRRFIVGAADCSFGGFRIVLQTVR